MVFCCFIAVDDGIIVIDAIVIIVIKFATNCQLKGITETIW